MPDRTVLVLGGGTGGLVAARRLRRRLTTIPIAGGKFLPKAGVFAHAEADVVARRIA